MEKTDYFDLYSGKVTSPKRVDAECVCSSFVLMELGEKTGDRRLRLGDLAAHEVIVVRCPCGRSLEYRLWSLQRRYRGTNLLPLPRPTRSYPVCKIVLN